MITARIVPEQRLQLARARPGVAMERVTDGNPALFAEIYALRHPRERVDEPAGIAFFIGCPAAACQDKGNHNAALVLLLSDLRAATRRELVLASPEPRKKWRDQIDQKKAIDFTL